MTRALDRVEVVEIALPFRRRFTMASASVTSRRLILVGLTRDGWTGWGESAPFPNYTGDDPQVAWDALTTAGQNLATGEPPGRLKLTAAAALGEAWRDLEAREAGTPLFLSLGGSPRPLPASVAVGITPDLDTLGEVIGEVVAAGYRRIKLKIRPGWDVEALRFVRNVFPGLDVGLDANGSYEDPEDDVFGDLDSMAPTYIEQPLGAEAISDHVALRKRIESLVCLDESIGSLADARLALEAGAADILCVKPGRIGVAASVDVHDLALDHGVAVKATGLLESGVGRAHTIAVGTLPGCSFHDLCTSRWYFTDDVLVEDWTLANGAISPSVGPGIGVDVDRARVEAVTVRRASFSG